MFKVLLGLFLSTTALCMDGKDSQNWGFNPNLTFVAGPTDNGSGGLNPIVNYDLLNSQLSDVRNVLSGRSSERILRIAEEHNNEIERAFSIAQEIQAEADQLVAQNQISMSSSSCRTSSVDVKALIRKAAKKKGAHGACEGLDLENLSKNDRLKQCRIQMFEARRERAIETLRSSIGKRHPEVATNLAREVSYWEPKLTPEKKYVFKLLDEFENLQGTINAQEQTTYTVLSEIAIETGLDSLSEAAALAELSADCGFQEAVSESWSALEIGRGILDIVLGFTPGVSLGKDAKEAITGYSLLPNVKTGEVEKLSTFERGMAVVGVVSLGTSNVATSTMKAIAKISRVAHYSLGSKFARKGIESSIDFAGRVVDSAGKHGIKILTGPTATKVDKVIVEALAGKGNLTSKLKLTADEALQAGEKWVGKGYKERKVGSGVFVSADGQRQFRMDNNSILGNHAPDVPHVHLETLAPGQKYPIANNHIPFHD